MRTFRIPPTPAIFICTGFPTQMHKRRFVKFTFSGLKIECKEVKNKAVTIAKVRAAKAAIHAD